VRIRRAIVRIEIVESVLRRGSGGAGHGRRCHSGLATNGRVETPPDSPASDREQKQESVVPAIV
jgi:hypothetical protein